MLEQVNNTNMILGVPDVCSYVTIAEKTISKISTITAHIRMWYYVLSP